MSKLRPTSDNPEHWPAVRDGTAYLMILQAVETKPGLIHGHLHQAGYSCAIGSFWDLHPRVALTERLVDEIAILNDSLPLGSAVQRKRLVSSWLRWKLQQIGMPGFGQARPVVGKS